MVVSKKEQKGDQILGLSRFFKIR